MSRGGRGGRGGGGFRGGRGGIGRIAGADVPWAYDPDIKPDYAPSELFPPVQQAIQRPLSRKEKRHVAFYRSFRDRIHEGPLYTVLGDNHQGVKYGTPAAALVDPFEGMPTFTQKYKRKVRKVPRLDTRPYILKFFPEELWSTLDPNHNSNDDPTTTRKKKLLNITMNNHRSHLSDEDITEAGFGPTADQHAAPQVKTEADDDEEEKTAEDEKAEDEEEDLDESFEDDEDEMAGDYDAERYFEDGADDDMNDGDLGGDDGGGEY
ncbi:MAG: hypothetical protein M1817_002063 [Caeruleum heppii]|nr:MAG: hypothetical protein M1817_002063 [Caeruleum heppii]